MRKAFTLMEVLVSIFIFLVILGIVMVDYGHSKKVEELRLITYDVEDSIRFVQSMALTGQEINNQIPTNGYGILINKLDNSYLIYGDNGTLGFNAGDLQYSKMDLPTNIMIQDLTCADEDNMYEEGTGSFDITFSAPRSSMEIYGFYAEPQMGYEIYYKGSNKAFCLINIKNPDISGSWDIKMIPLSSRIWTEFNN